MTTPPKSLRQAQFHGRPDEQRCGATDRYGIGFQNTGEKLVFFWGKTLNMIEASPFFRKTMPFLLERKNGELPNWF